MTVTAPPEGYVGVGADGHALMPVRHGASARRLLVWAEGEWLAVYSIDHVNRRSVDVVYTRGVPGADHAGLRHSQRVVPERIARPVDMDTRR